MRRRRSGRGLFLALCMLLSLGALKIRADARSFYENPGIEFAPDGKAWTIREALPGKEDETDRNAPRCWYPKGESYQTGNVSSLRPLQTGEHLYRYQRTGIVPIGRWTVAHREAQCVHPDYPFFHGMYYPMGICRKNYYSGWQAWCADCGEIVMDGLVYLSREKMKTLSEIDTDLDYFYDCPSCGHLEQGYRIRHFCKEISANRYRVVYRANAGDAVGYMQPSFHMYGNAKFYEGESVTPVQTLSLCSFERIGYRFAGWNTRPDGRGDSYTDGQEILNLTEENYEPGSDQGTIVLYAQWQKTVGQLLVDPGAGQYRGKAGVSSFSVRYGETFWAKAEEVTAPGGALVRFETFGGSSLEPLRGKMEFAGWRLDQPAQGNLRGEAYEYLGEDGGKDRIEALYQEEGIRLPLPVKQGYSFGGWYQDAACTVQVGNAGDLYVPTSDVTLYACWVDLVLHAKVNLVSNEGRGAVDLRWSQADGKHKTYLLFQRKEGEDFQRIYSADEAAVSAEEKTFAYRGEEECFRISASGFYELSAFGAQGGAYGGFSGGNGGSAKGEFYLEQGDVLTVLVGGSDGFGGGGDGNEYGNGGGRTQISSEKQGILLIAGGGGGASPGGSGGDGGTQEKLWEAGSGAGQSGDGGGGGGAVGGMAGSYQVHEHDESCKHEHLGNSTNGGPCYREVSVEKTCRVLIKGPNTDGRNTACVVCLAAGLPAEHSIILYGWAIDHKDCGLGIDYGLHGWWECSFCKRVTSEYGAGKNKPADSTHTYVKKEYVLECDREYDCTETAGVRLPSGGGSSYVKKEAARSYECQAGVRTGDGMAQVRPVSIGFWSETELIGAKAPDLEAPEKIDLESLKKEAADGGKIRISFQEPRDRGSVYYHQVKSYPVGSEELLCTSNVTCTEVVTGTAGYYYRIDRQKETVLTSKNADNRELILRESNLLVERAKEDRYLHLAAVDRAGNIAESICVELFGEDHPERQEKIAWKLYTEQMEASGILEGTDYGSVAKKEENVYFVRADARTPFLLRFTGRMDGPARTDYQIDRAAFGFRIPGIEAEGAYTLLLPGGNLSDLEETDAGQCGRMLVGRDLLQAGMYGKAVRTDRGKTLDVFQSFTLDNAYHNRSLMLFPGIGADLKEGGALTKMTSDRAQDENNAILIIGDAEAPVIHGLEKLENLSSIDREGEESLLLDLWAEDTVSGVQSFRIRLQNLDNYGELTYESEEDGHIRMDLSEELPIFCGDLKWTIRAKDRVGNETVVETGATEFGLSAKIIRKLPPHTPQFKRGESGILKVTVWGYADRLEIVFPKEFTEQNPLLDRVVTYAVPKEKAEEEVEFMIPLYLTDSREYAVAVRAYKGDQLLERRPVLCTMQVHDTVLGELRTRLR